MINTPARFAYEVLATEIAALIGNGTFRPGDRLPSVRRMSAQRVLSVPTVVQAYRLLEARRVVTARPQSGFYVLPAATGRLAATTHAHPLPDPKVVATGDLIMRCLEMVADPNLVPLGTALPDPHILPSYSLARCLAREMRRSAPRSTAVSTPSGIPELRHEIARRTFDGGANVSADDVIVTCGCAEALVLCLRALTRPGDVVAVESPTYFGTLQALEILGLRALEIPVDPLTGISLEVLEQALRRGGIATVVVTPTVHNPLGCTMPDGRKRELVGLLARYKVPAIEDDTYGELHFSSVRPRLLRAFDEEGWVLTCGSFSKTLAPGYRIGWTIPGRYRDEVLHVKLATTAASSVPPQLALAAYIASGNYDPYLRRVKQSFQTNVARLSYELLQRLPATTTISAPSGGFLLWVQLPEGVDAVQLQRFGLRQGMSIAPGPAFSASGAYKRCVRVNAGYCWSDHTASAITMLNDLVVSMIERGAEEAPALQ